MNKHKLSEMRDEDLVVFAGSNVFTVETLKRLLADSDVYRGVNWYKAEPIELDVKEEKEL